MSDKEINHWENPSSITASATSEENSKNEKKKQHKISSSIGMTLIHSPTKDYKPKPLRRNQTPVHPSASFIRSSYRRVGHLLNLSELDNDPEINGRTAEDFYL